MSTPTCVTQVCGWLLCFFGRHQNVDYACEPECCGGQVYRFCLRCGKTEELR